MHKYLHDMPPSVQVGVLSAELPPCPFLTLSLSFVRARQGLAQNPLLDEERIPSQVDPKPSAHEMLGTGRRPVTRGLKQRQVAGASTSVTVPENGDRAAEAADVAEARKRSWRRTLLLCLAVTVHNIPEGMAVGVGFGAVGTTPSATFAAARYDPLRLSGPFSTLEPGASHICVDKGRCIGCVVSHVDIV